MFPSGTEGAKQGEFNGKYGTWNTAIFGYANCSLSPAKRDRWAGTAPGKYVWQKETPSFLLKELFRRENSVQTCSTMTAFFLLMVNLLCKK